MKFARKIELIEVVLVQWHNLILQIGSKPSLSAIDLTNNGVRLNFPRYSKIVEYYAA